MGSHGGPWEPEDRRNSRHNKHRRTWLRSFSPVPSGLTLTHIRTCRVLRAINSLSQLPRGAEATALRGSSLLKQAQEEGFETESS